MAEAETPAVDSGVLYCTVHPNVETALRCNRCGRPMCNRCAVRTPVGYRCRECVRGQQQVFYTAQTLDPGDVYFGNRTRLTYVEDFFQGGGGPGSGAMQVVVWMGR